MMSLGFRPKPTPIISAIASSPPMPGGPSGGDWCEIDGRRMQVSAFPIGIDTEAFAQEARAAEKNSTVKRTLASLEGRDLVIGVDRLDYSKGLKQRMEAFATFLERSPQAARARVTMLQITPKSRSEVPEYARMQRELEEEAGRINGKHRRCRLDAACAISTNR